MIKFYYTITRLGEGLSSEERGVASKNDTAATIGAAKRKVTNKVKWNEKADWRQIQTHPKDHPDDLTPIGLYIKSNSEYVAMIRVANDDAEGDD